MSDSVEKLRTGLVCSLESSKGAKIELVNRSLGFNGLSVYKDAKVRKIEIKTMKNSVKWIAINGIRAVDKLLFDRDYWIYYILLPENIIIITRGINFIQTQLGIKNTYKDEIVNLKKWMDLSKLLTKHNKFKFTPKINLTFKTPIRKVVQEILNKSNLEKWQDSVIEIWQNLDNWKKQYESPTYNEY